MGALYEPLIERDHHAFAAAARAFVASHSDDELWIAVTRFAVLAYAPSQHAKRAVMACRAAREVRDELGNRWVDLVLECARYAGESRQPWSEPPLIEPPEVDASHDRGIDELREAVEAGDRQRAERWLAANLDDPRLVSELRALARGDALLIADAAEALDPHVGGKGRYALTRLPVLELLAGDDSEESDAPLDRLIARVVAERGSVDSVRAVFLYDARHRDASDTNGTNAMNRTRRSALLLEPYRLARDYAQTLIAHSVARRLPASADVSGFLAAVHENLEHGESFAEWSFA